MRCTCWRWSWFKFLSTNYRTNSCNYF